MPAVAAMPITPVLGQLRDLFIVAPAYPHPENAAAGAFFTAADLEATHNGLIVHGRVDYQHDGGQFYLGGFSATLFAQQSAAYLPLTIAGAILGLVAGWLLVAALVYRLRSSSAGDRRTVSVSSGAALAMAVPPVFAITRQAVLLAIHVGDTRFPVFTLHSVLQEGMSVDGPPGWLIPACTIAAAASGALTIVIALTRATPSPASTPRLAAVDDDR